MDKYPTDESTTFSKGLVIGMITGGAVGAAVALLMAPKSGRDLRGDISRVTNSYLSNSSDTIVNASEKAQEIVNEGRRRAEVIIEDARDRATTLLTDAENIVNEARAKARSKTKDLSDDVERATAGEGTPPSKPKG